MMITKIKINKRIGSDKGARCEFGYNLKSVQEVVSTENLITRVYPQAYNGYVLPNEECVDSPYINNYQMYIGALSSLMT
ncbi:MAG: phage tail spike protein [Holdemanella porci]